MDQKKTRLEIVDMIIELGLKARKQKKEQEALQYFEQAIKAYPPNVPAYVEAGKSLKALQKLSEAKQRFKQTLQKKADHLEVLMELGNIAYLEKEWEKALEKFQAAVKYHSNHPNAYVQAGKSLKNLEHRFSNREQSSIEREREVWGVWEVLKN